jgi:hypothetical protein
MVDPFFHSLHAMLFETNNREDQHVLDRVSSRSPILKTAVSLIVNRPKLTLTREVRYRFAAMWSSMNRSTLNKHSDWNAIRMGGGSIGFSFRFPIRPLGFWQIASTKESLVPIE